MKTLIAATLLSLMMVPKVNVVYDFSKNSEKEWRIVNDGVMGGLSQGYFQTNEDGHGVFTGNVSLENNGGFTSLRHRNSYSGIEEYKKVILKVKGNGSRYQFRLKSNAYQSHSYIQYFETNGKWQEIELNLKDFYPSWRGRKLDLENFNSNVIEEMTFLIANYKAEEFNLEIDFIALK